MKHHHDLLSWDFSNLWNKPQGPQIQSPSHQQVQSRFESIEAKKSAWGFEQALGLISAEQLKEMEKVASEVRREHDGLLCFGIGGSSLGPLTLLEALHHHFGNTMPYHWVSNFDAPSIEEAEFYLSEHRRVATVLISKSGGTIETLGAFFALYSKLDAKAIVTITDPEQGELRRLTEQQKWSSFPIPPSLGGRFSVLSPVGLFPAALMGFKFQEIYEGAVELSAFISEQSPTQNPAYLLATSLYLWMTEHGGHIQVLMPYLSSLRSFSDWYTQLFAESLGKKKGESAVGMTPFPGLGSRDQHSILQLLQEGPRDKVVGFLDVGEAAYEGSKPIPRPPFPTQSIEHLFQKPVAQFNRLARQAVEQSLSEDGVPTYHIEIPRVDAKCLGALFYFYELTCAYMGEMLEIDTFNQPGVEKAKTLWKESLI